MPVASTKRIATGRPASQNRSMSEHKAVSVRVTGRVQGVAYRAWARDEAVSLGLSGWVRNEDDGSVSALIVGPGDAVEEMVARMRRGPPAALVSDVAVEERTIDTNTSGFRITR